MEPSVVSQDKHVQKLQIKNKTYGGAVVNTDIEIRSCNNTTGGLEENHSFPLFNGDTCLKELSWHT
jgi:hypothetical protein